MPAGLRGFGLSVIPLCENIEPPPVLSGIEDKLALGVWPPMVLFCILEVPELEEPRSVLGG
jgi:hypothetical protein